MIVFVIYLATLYFVGQFLNITFQIEIELFGVSFIFTRHPSPVTRHPPPVEKCCRHISDISETRCSTTNIGTGAVDYCLWIMDQKLRATFGQ